MKEKVLMKESEIKRVGKVKKKIWCLNYDFRQINKVIERSSIIVAEQVSNH